ncbi:MAG: dipeptidyl-peptidase [Bryobacteraceae bacterium]|nr:MAG: dipeptidyl-peptidase [Bryobacteraceae bacterium]
MKRTRLFLCAWLAMGLVQADEGMWLFNAVPESQLASKHGFRPTKEFLDHLRLSSVRFGGASGSFVSPNGLIFTNHHVASRCIQNVSSKEHNYMRDGFYADSPEKELKCPGLEVQVLEEITDVTDRVRQAVTAPPSDAKAAQQRQAAINTLEKECMDRHGGACSVVTLYSGALYHLYRYRKYTDVRLVFAPEEAIAFFGGDPDNFTYPRYDLDITFLRAYENGRPAQTPHYLKWSRTGPREGELALVSGHPGSTDRFITVAQFEYLRDVSYPRSLRSLSAVISALKEYGSKSEENHRVARDKLFGAENSFKVRDGELKGMRETWLMEAKRRSEEQFRKAVAANAAAKDEVGDAFEKIAAAYEKWKPRSAEYLLESGAMLCDMFSYARHLYRLAEERQKPNAERLREYSDAALPSLEHRLTAQTPVTPELEALMLQKWFELLQAELGESSAVVRQILNGKTPAEAARGYIFSSKLQDAAERRKLLEDPAAARSSDDGMIRLVRMIDPQARAIRRVYEEEFDAVVRDAASRIARARFTLYGTSVYPDATGSLRLSFGRIEGYRNAQGQPVRWYTDFDGLYGRATGKDPYRLPERWLERKGALKRKTAFNFVSTADIIGGNSGSPTVNTRGEVIGIVFDSNYEAMHNRFLYGMERGERCVHVASDGIIEALRAVYGAGRVLEELGFAKAAK